jgi:hypothetical protein
MPIGRVQKMCRNRADCARWFTLLLLVQQILLILVLRERQGNLTGRFGSPIGNELQRKCLNLPTRSLKS